MQREKIKNILFLIIFIPVSFGIFLFLLTHPIGEGSVDIYKIEIIFHDSRINENISCPDTIIKGMAFPVVFELETEKELRYEIWRKDGDCDMEIIDELRNISKRGYVFQFESDGLIGLVRKPMDICFTNPIATIKVCHETED